MIHPLPWTVKYREEINGNLRPYIVDAIDRPVVVMSIAGEETALQICNAVNKMTYEQRIEAAKQLLANEGYEVRGGLE